MLKKLFVVVLVSVTLPAFAGFASLRPPAGVSKGPTGWKYKPPANDANITNGTVRTDATLNVGGQEVKMPASMRFASNAANIVATGLSLNPWMLAAGVIGGLILDQYAQRGLNPGLPPQPGWTEDLDQYEYSVNGGATWQGSANAACKTLGDGNYYMWGNVETGGYCRNGGVYGEGFNYGTPIRRGSTRIQPLTPEEVAAKTQDMIVTLPEIPKYWPDPLPIDEPVVDPVPKTVPIGTPQPMPKADPNDQNEPDRWKTPVLEIRPAPTPDDPWRVDLTHRDVIRLDPLPPVSTDPITDPSDPTKPPEQISNERQPSLCELYPNIVACQELGSPSREVLNKTSQAVTVVATTFASSSSCPAPLSTTVFGSQVQISYSPLCDVLGNLKFLFAAIAAFIAAYILADSFRVT